MWIFICFFPKYESLLAESVALCSSFFQIQLVPVNRFIQLCSSTDYLLWLARVLSFFLTDMNWILCGLVLFEIQSKHVSQQWSAGLLEVCLGYITSFFQIIPVASKFRAPDLFLRGGVYLKTIRGAGGGGVLVVPKYWWHLLCVVTVSLLHFSPVTLSTLKTSVEELGAVVVY